jgi:hypothetical protein
MASIWETLKNKVMLILLAGVVSITEVLFVGDVTVYSPHNNHGREMMHERIIHNQAPEGGWSTVGANAVNIRIAIPYLVEFVRHITGTHILPLYKTVDLICIWLGFVIFFSFLREWFTAQECALACLYFAAVLPLTFAYHYYQPWDRASFVLWLLAIWCVRAQRFWQFSAFATVAVLIKYDAVILPALYFLANSTLQNWRTTLVRSCATQLILLAIFFGLIVLMPGGFEPRHYTAQILRNVGMIIDHFLIFYAPFLAFGLPIMLAILGYAMSDRFMRASLWFAGPIAFILFVATNFEEVRAETMFFPLLAPAALLGLRRIMDEPIFPKQGARKRNAST